MHIFVNELSVHEQFADFREFRAALSKMMKIRNVARRFGCEVQCQTTLLYDRKPMPNLSLREAVGRLSDQNEKRSIMSWLSKAGPFWDGQGCHDPDEYLECGNDVVTDTSVGEAAFRLMHDMSTGLVSFFPSAWDFTPVEVIWRREAEGGSVRVARLENWWCSKDLDEALQKMPPLNTWDNFRKAAVNRFGQLKFSKGCFASLAGKTFSQAAAKRFWERLDILNRLSGARGEDGMRTKEGHQIYQMHFTGDNAWFCDSSDTEKRKFREALTFPHPSDGVATLFPWHGRVAHNNMRLHFSWPPKAGEPMYVVYVGPKLTKH